MVVRRIAISSSSLRIADANVEQEAVELRFGQRIRAFLLDRILRREHEERLGQAHRVAARGHAMLLHRLEQRGLRARRRAVDLVGEHDVGEDRPAHEPEAARAGRRVLLEDLGAGDVARHEVRRELDAAELEVHRLGERAHHERFRKPRHADEQRVSAGDERHQDLVEHALLPDDAPLDFGAQPRRRGDERVALVRGRSDGHGDVRHGATSALSGPAGAAGTSAAGSIRR